MRQIRVGLLAASVGPKLKSLMNLLKRRRAKMQASGQALNVESWHSNPGIRTIAKLPVNRRRADKAGMVSGGKVGPNKIPVVAKGLAGLSRGQAKTALKTAQETYKGTTRVGHGLSKHAGRNPDIWGKVTGSQKRWNGQAMKHLREIFRGPGEFSKVTNNKGITFLEKRLSDGRGLRLNQDYTFKGFID